MTPELESDIRECLLRCIREHEDEWLGIEAESLLKRMAQEASAPDHCAHCQALVADLKRGLDIMRKGLDR